MTRVVLSAAQIAEATGAMPARAALFVDALNNAMDEFQIAENGRRSAAFLAQVGHESGGLRYLREIWGPTKAQAGYEGRRDLGNTEPGDGFRFRGRGLIQITGRANYVAAADGLHLPLLQHPELLEAIDNATDSAAWWWWSHGLNALADAGEFGAITRAINGGLNGQPDRLRLWAAARTALGTIDETEA